MGLLRSPDFSGYLSKPVALQYPKAHAAPEILNCYSGFDTLRNTTGWQCVSIAQEWRLR